ncbi:MAG: biopolymer transporter ExbD [Deltaproteobacteria bacterium]|nr:MAG: biopolymer transporter ExbD [Deltaproteobacteria bacterium]
MGGGSGGGDDELITAINVTPLVDVVLVLLIILMVTATAIVSKTIPMELPEAAGPTDSVPTTMAVSIDADGKLYLDAEEVDEDGLRRRIRAAREADEDLRAVIAADGRINHARVVQVIDLLRQERVTKFAINVRPSDLER